MRGIVGNAEAKDQRFAGNQPGAVLIGEVDLAVDQFAVAAVLDSGQMGENTASIGSVVG